MPSVPRSDRRERRDRLTAYVMERLVRETAVYGAASKIAKATGFTPTHISTVKNGRGPVGDDFVRALAEYWHMSVADIEAEAMKGPAPAKKPSGATSARSMVRSSPEFAAASADVQRAYDAITTSDPMSVVGWALELERLLEWERRGWKLADLPQNAPERPQAVRARKP